MKAQIPYTHKHTHARTSQVHLNREEPLGNQGKRMGEDVRRNERHTENGVGARGEGWSHEQEEAERRA